jgi:hypothetical protein
MVVHLMESSTDSVDVFITCLRWKSQCFRERSEEKIDWKTELSTEEAKRR